MALSLEKEFTVDDAWDYLKSKYSNHKLSRVMKVGKTTGNGYRDEWYVKQAYLDEVCDDMSLINEDNAQFLLESFYDTRRMWYNTRDHSQVIKKILELKMFDQEYIDNKFKKFLGIGAFSACDLLWNDVTDKAKDEVAGDLMPGLHRGSRSEDAIVYLFDKGWINFKKKKYSPRNYRSCLNELGVRTLKRIDFNLSDEVIKILIKKQGGRTTSSYERRIEYLFTLPKFRKKVVGNKKWMLYEVGSSSKFVDYWPREYQQPYIDQLLEEYKEKRRLNPKKEAKKEKEEEFVERTDFSREFFKTCLPELRKLKMAKNKLFKQKECTDEAMLDALELLYKIKIPHTGTMQYEVENEFDFEELVQERFSKKYVEKYRGEEFNPKKVRRRIEREAAKLIGIKPEDIVPVPIGFYWVQNKDARRIIGADIQDKIVSLKVMNRIISDVTDQHKSKRNIPEAKRACEFTKEELIGKFVITEDIVMSGFIKGTMTLKQLGYLVGEIKENQYGERHGYDNFWDDHVPDRNYLVIKLENNTGAKELEKKSWKKAGHLYAIDLTQTLQVFDSVKDARKYAKMLNDDIMGALTLDH